MRSVALSNILNAGERNFHLPSMQATPPPCVLNPLIPSWGNSDQAPPNLLLTPPPRPLLPGVGRGA